MIGKITVGKSFRAIINYCLHDKIPEQNLQAVKDRAEVLLYNKNFGNERELVQQFNEVRQLNLKLSKPVLHITLSLAPGEQFGKDKLMEMSEHCAKEIGFENNQYLVITHRDTDHQHLHLIANRIGFDKRTVSDSNSYKKIANYCRKMELKYGIKQVLSPKKYLSPQQRNTPRHDQRKEHMRQDIKQALNKCTSYNEFEQRMKEKGYEITKGRGISFTDEKKVKGSELGYSLQTIERILQHQNGLQVKQTHQDQYKQIQTGKEVFKENNSYNGQQFRFELLDQLMRPEKQQEQNLSMYENRKKKKKQSRHL